jgi:hypothetical protein
MMLIGASTKSYLDATKAWCDASVQLQSSLAKYYDPQKCKQADGISQAVKQALDVHEHINVLRRSMAQVFVDSALDPLRDLCGERLPELQVRAYCPSDWLKLTCTPDLCRLALRRDKIHCGIMTPSEGSTSP